MIFSLWKLCPTLTF